MEIKKLKFGDVLLDVAPKAAGFFNHATEELFYQKLENKQLKDGFHFVNVEGYREEDVTPEGKLVGAVKKIENYLFTILYELGSFLFTIEIKNLNTETIIQKNITVSALGSTGLSPDYFSGSSASIAVEAQWQILKSIKNPNIVFVILKRSLMYSSNGLIINIYKIDLNNLEAEPTLFEFAKDPTFNISFITSTNNPDVRVMQGQVDQYLVLSYAGGTSSSREFVYSLNEEKTYYNPVLTPSQSNDYTTSPTSYTSFLSTLQGKLTFYLKKGFFPYGGLGNPSNANKAKRLLKTNFNNKKIDIIPMIYDTVVIGEAGLFEAEANGPTAKIIKSSKVLFAKENSLILLEGSEKTISANSTNNRNVIEIEFTGENESVVLSSPTTVSTFSMMGNAAKVIETNDCVFLEAYGFEAIAGTTSQRKRNFKLNKNGSISVEEVHFENSGETDVFTGPLVYKTTRVSGTSDAGVEYMLASKVPEVGDKIYQGPKLTGNEKEIIAVDTEAKTVTLLYSGGEQVRSYNSTPFKDTRFEIRAVLKDNMFLINSNESYAPTEIYVVSLENGEFKKGKKVLNGFKEFEIGTILKDGNGTEFLNLLSYTPGAAQANPGKKFETYTIDNEGNISLFSEGYAITDPSNAHGNGGSNFDHFKDFAESEEVFESGNFEVATVGDEKLYFFLGQLIFSNFERNGSGLQYEDMYPETGTTKIMPNYLFRNGFYYMDRMDLWTKLNNQEVLRVNIKNKLIKTTLSEKIISYKKAKHVFGNVEIKFNL
jgi:hypothetical protein